MAGGKQTPRQKMINLMYLIFIAMLALNMSKEVLAAFGLMNEKLETSNANMDENNSTFFASLETKASENEEEYGELYEDAQQIKQLSDNYYSYLEGLKKEMTADLEDPKDYVVMDKSDYLDQKFFQGDNLGPEGKKFMEQIETYREGVINTLPEGEFESLKSAVRTRFATGGEDGKVEKRDGTRQDWINYHFEGFPLVASLTKMTQLQTDIKTTEQEILKTLLEGELTEAVSLTNFKASLFADRSAFYSGERYDGKIGVSKTDNTSTPVEAELTLDGRPLTQGKDYELEAGGIKLLIGTGNPGDHKIAGTMYFMQDGEKVPVEVNNTFTTIPRPNEAVISADKMNVVYRGVANPITISMPGVSDNNVKAVAPGLTQRSGSNYIMNPGTGREVTINVTGVIDGKSFPSKKTFRIKDIPRPSGTVRGESGSIKMPRNNLEIATVSAMLEDFDFDLNLAVSEFKFKVPGQPTVVVQGNKLDSRAKSVLQRADRGESVQIFDIQAYITNNKSYKLKKVSPVVVELTN